MASEHRDYAKIVAKAWTDPAFRDRLIADPRKALNEQGWGIDNSVHVEVKPDSDKHSLVLGLPKRPEGLTDDQLNKNPPPNPCCCF
jgi:hypothetical protein